MYLCFSPSLSPFSLSLSHLNISTSAGYSLSQGSVSCLSLLNLLIPGLFQVRLIKLTPAPAPLQSVTGSVSITPSGFSSDVRKLWAAALLRPGEKNDLRLKE